MAEAKLKPTLSRKFQFQYVVFLVCRLFQTVGCHCLMCLSGTKDMGQKYVHNPNYYDSILQISGLKFNIYELSPL